MVLRALGGLGFEFLGFRAVVFYSFAHFIRS